MNTGGRTHILVYFLQSQNGDVVLLKDRFGTHHLNLGTLKLEEQYGSENTDKYKFIGTVSGEAYPLKFVPPSVWSEADASKKING
jgi:hypothetical protein